MPDGGGEEEPLSAHRASSVGMSTDRCAPPSPSATPKRGALKAGHAGRELSSAESSPDSEALGTTRLTRKLSWRTNSDGLDLLMVHPIHDTHYPPSSGWERTHRSAVVLLLIICTAGATLLVIRLVASPFLEANSQHSHHHG